MNLRSYQRQWVINWGGRLGIPPLPAPDFASGNHRFGPARLGGAL
jgi:hypothetical protein